MDGENLSLTSRVQKITEALYRVTDLLPDKEPLKWVLRNNAIEIFDSLEAEKLDISSLISRICRFLELAFSSTAFVSTINFEILRREYLVLADLIEKKREESQSLKNLLPLFEGQIANEGKSEGSSTSFKEESISKGQDKGQSNGHKGQNNLKDRQKQILEFIKTSNWVTIKEISSALPQFGAKSIQRDLLEMVGIGALQKAGDKRWRKYGIN
jgi:hypothetical protein